jgi:hypothetical protein
MADQPPELIEQVGTTPVGEVWRARSAEGKEVLASQTLLADETSRQAAVDRLRRISRISDRRLMPVRGWWSDPAGVWVVSDLEQGVSLPDLPGGGFLSPQQAAAISFAVLEGLKALHSEGLSHGYLVPENVRVMPDGSVLLTGHQLATLGFPSQEELAVEIRASGRIVCQAFGITPERTSGAPRAIEHAAPALVVTARAIAAGTMRADIGSALTALRETAGPLGGPERLGLGAAELSSLVAAKRGGGSPGELRYRSLSAPIGSGSFSTPPPPTLPPPVPPRPAAPLPAPYLPPPPAPPLAVPTPPPTPTTTTPAPSAAPAPSAPRRSWEERQAAPVEDFGDEGGGPNWALIGGGVLVLLILAVGIYFGRGLLVGSSNPTGSNSPGITSSASPSASAKATGTPTPVPGALPTFGPASVGQVKDVTVRQASPSCSPGSSCTFEVVIDVNSPGTSSAVTWSFKVFDPCTGTTTSMDGGSITPDPGPWTSFDGNKAITLPSAKGLLDVVALSGPTDVAASTPLQVGAGGC